MPEEKIEPPKSDVEKQQNNESVGDEIRTEVGKLRINAEALKGDLTDEAKFNRPRSDESIHRLASSAQKLIIGATALVGIVAIGTLVSPEVSQKLQEFNQMAQDFTIQHFAVIMPAILAVVTAALGPGIVKGILEERRRKREEEDDNEK